jgi:two-component system, NtrC family, response regulator HydG
MARPEQESDGGETALDGAPREETRAFHVDVLSGVDAGASVAVDGMAYIGKSAVCELTLTDPKVSRRHVEVEDTPLGLRLRDLRSTNGTFVDGTRVVEAFVQAGARVRLGDTLLEVSEAAQVKARARSTLMKFRRVVGASEAMRRLYARCEQVAPTEIPVLIEGETGTGKELLAESLHEASPRAHAPFVVFDCTTVSPQLLEASLFGHERGAYTGAQTSRPGVFEAAHGGTLLIDEIGDLDIALQSKLLRAVERKEVQRIGSARWVKVDVRLLSATRRDLEAEIQAGRFRDDLYFRLAVARLRLPPLRDRAGDVELLATHIWRGLSGGAVPFPGDFLPRWSSYAWPGNVRELANAVHRRFALGEGDAFDDDDAPTPLLGSADVIDGLLAEGVPYTSARRRVLEEFNKRFVEVALERSGGSVSKAAASFGIARRYFTRIKARST